MNRINRLSISIITSNWKFELLEDLNSYEFTWITVVRLWLLPHSRCVLFLKYLLSVITVKVDINELVNKDLAYLVFNIL